MASIPRGVLDEVGQLGLTQARANHVPPRATVVTTDHVRRRVVIRIDDLALWAIVPGFEPHHARVAHGVLAVPLLRRRGRAVSAFDAPIATPAGGVTNAHGGQARGVHGQLAVGAENPLNVTGNDRGIADDAPRRLAWITHSPRCDRDDRGESRSGGGRNAIRSGGAGLRVVCSDGRRRVCRLRRWRRRRWRRRPSLFRGRFRIRAGAHRHCADGSHSSCTQRDARVVRVSKDRWRCC